MAKINKRIEIVAATRPGLSSMSAKSRRAVQTLLLKHYAQVDITIVNTLADLAALADRQPDLVFLGMKYVPSRPFLGQADPNKIWLSQYLGERGIAYTGSSYSAVELELHKERAKRQVELAGLATARFHHIPAGATLVAGETTLTYPLFVKPTNRGGGTGVDAQSLVYDFRHLQSKVRSLASDLQADALVEEYLPGREFSVGILRQLGSDDYVAMPLELVAPADEAGARFLSGQVKVADTEYHLEVTDTKLRAAINTLAIGAFHALGAQDYGRIDIRLDANGEPHFLEANLLPSLIAQYGNFPKACMLNLNLGYESMILHIVDLAFARPLTTPELFDDAATSRSAMPIIARLRPAMDVL